MEESNILSKESQEEINARVALQLAKDIFVVVKQPEFLKNYDAETRHRVLISKFPNFARAYPIVLRFMAREVKYNEHAFKKFLDKLKTDPERGIDAYIMRQADYAKFLYIEDCRNEHKHWSMKIANKIWKNEYEHMHKIVKKLKEDEKKAKNEFEEESKAYLEQRRKELLEFIVSQSNNENQEEKISLPESIPIRSRVLKEEKHDRYEKPKNEELDTSWLIGTSADIKLQKKYKR